MLFEGVVYSDCRAKYAAVFLGYRAPLPCEQLGLQLENLTSGLCQLVRVRSLLFGFAAFAHFIKAMRRDAELFRNIGDGITALSDLTDRFVLELWGKSFVAHTPLLDSRR
jgi:hypothetical protein